MSYIKDAIDITLSIKPTDDYQKNAEIIDELLEIILDNFAPPKKFNKDDPECIELIQESDKILTLPRCEGWYDILVKYPPEFSEAMLPIALILYVLSPKGRVNLDFDISAAKHWETICDIYGYYICSHNDWRQNSD